MANENELFLTDVNESVVSDVNLDGSEENESGCEEDENDESVMAMSEEEEHIYERQ